MIENAEVLHAVNLSVGGKAFYVCLNGYTRLSGSPNLTCTTSDDFGLLWEGSILKCIEHDNDSKL